MNPGYDFALVGEAARSLMGVTSARRKKGLAVIEALAANPFVDPDFRDTAPSGRTYSMLIRGSVTVTYWVDHAVKELRVLKVEFD
ncbi:MAG: hypothetical protein ACREIA_01860 [Opitutaceae bacterium]